MIEFDIKMMFRDLRDIKYAEHIHGSRILKIII